jgi:hypothetical protein
MSVVKMILNAKSTVTTLIAKEMIKNEMKKLADQSSNIETICVEGGAQMGEALNLLIKSVVEYCNKEEVITETAEWVAVHHTDIKKGIEILKELADISKRIIDGQFKELATKQAQEISVFISEQFEKADEDEIIKERQKEINNAVKELTTFINE